MKEAVPSAFSNFREGLKDVLASVVGSAACVYTGQPFDTVKVRLQVNPGEFSSTYQCLRRTVVNEGFFALWKGSVPAFSGALAENAMAFGTNGLLKRIFDLDGHRTGSNEGDLRVWGPLATAAITGACVSVVLCPCDMLKCRAQVNIANGMVVESLGQMMMKIVRHSGPLGLYKGFSAQVIRDIPFYSTFFGSYEILCQVLKRSTNWDDSAIYFLSGG